MLVLPDGRIFKSPGEDAVGISRLPEHLINKDVIEFSNCPEDDLSIHILRLIGLHLKNMNDEQKQEIINTLNVQLGICPNRIARI
jgi:hypothetical protein